MKQIKKFKESDNRKKITKASTNNGFNVGHDSDFRQKHKTKQYITPYKHPRKEKYEHRCIMSALSNVPHGTSILNWPCGCSKLLPLLKSLGYNVTSADSSPDVVSRIRLYGGLLGENCIHDMDDFKVVNIFQTDFDDDFFGAAVINQLFTCLPVTQIRQMILKELRRICAGPIVVSLFCNTMIHELKQYEKKYDFALNRKAIKEEVNKCDLAVKKWIPKIGSRATNSCVVLIRDNN